MEESPVIAVAYDNAFHFYYDENFRILEELGAKLVRFSPMADHSLPEGTAGLYLGGGYVEEYAAELSRNGTLKGIIKMALEAGMPVLAEGGGFLYLQESMCGQNGEPYPMVGFLPGRSERGHKRARFGYITLTAQKDNLLCRKGESIAGHEFHHWDSNCPGVDFLAEKPIGGRSWYGGVASETFYAGFPHLYFPNNTVFAENFIRKVGEFSERIRA